MPLDPSIYSLGGNLPKQFNPLEAQAQSLQVQGMQQENRARSLGLKAAEQQASDVASLDKATAGGVPSTLDAFLARLPGHMHAAVRKQWLEADEAAGKVRKAKTEAEAAEADYFGGLAATLKSYDYDPATAQIILQHAKENGHDTSQIEQLMQQDPSKLPALVEGLIAGSKQQRELADKEKGTAQTGAHNAATEANAAASLAETARSHKASEAQTAKRDAATNAYHAAEIAIKKQQAENEDAVPTLSQAATDAMAQTLAIDGTLPTLGNGKKAAAAKERIINRAAELYPGLNTAEAKATWKANAGSLAKLQTTRDSVHAFEQTAISNIDRFLGVAKNVVDTGIPALNSPARFIAARLMGSPDQSAYDAARTTAVVEIAKVVNNPNLSGVLSDSARQEVQDFNPHDATLSQTIHVMELLKKEMAGRTSKLDTEITDVRGRMQQVAGQPVRGAQVSAPSVAQPAATGKIHARDPQGVLHEAAAGTPLPQGWKLEG